MFTSQRIYILSLLISIAAIFPAAAQKIDKNEVYEKLMEKYAEPETIVVRFHLPGIEDMQGLLKAKRGNKYRLRMNGQTVVSDGETIWNYMPADKSVMISNYGDAGDALSLEQFFFDIIDSFKPTGLYRYTASDRENSYKLKLEPPQSGANIHDIKSIDLYFDIGTYDILSIAVYTAGDNFSWDIDSIRMDEDLSDDVFEFQPPEDAEVIDMR
jgi:outer membrane lipoprotein-sorting protein